MMSGTDGGSAARRSLLYLSYDVSRRTPEEYLKMARAFADSAVLLFGGITGGHLPPTFHHAKAAATPLEHSVELFLKGAIALAGDPVPRTHDTVRLLARFRELYPGVEFKFSGRVDEIVYDSKMRPPTQFTRYPTDRGGAPWKGHDHFDPVVWLEESKRFRDDYRRLEPLLRERSSGSSESRAQE